MIGVPAAIVPVLDLLKNELSIKQNMINVTEYNNKKHQMALKDEFVKTATPSLIGHFKRQAMIVIVMVKKMIDLANHANQCSLSLKPMIFIASLRRFSFSTVSNYGNEHESLTLLQSSSKIICHTLTVLMHTYKKLLMIITGNRNSSPKSSLSDLYGGYGNRCT